MQYQAKQRPAPKGTGAVTGWPTQQKKQQLSGSKPIKGRQNTAVKNKQQATVGYAPTTKQRPTAPTPQPVRSNRRPSASKYGVKGDSSNVAAKQQANNKRYNAKASRVGTSRSQPSLAGSPRYAISPIFKQSTYYKKASIPGAAGNSTWQTIFNPPDKIPLGYGGGGIPNPDKTPVDLPDKQPCSCGHSGNGCTVLSNFAIGSFELTPEHKKQILELAHTILSNNINFVTTTGHADATGSDENNMYLGNNRSIAVRRELKNTLHKLKLWSPTSIYFRTDTKGESEPISATDKGANRRVEVCLK